MHFKWMRLVVISMVEYKQFNYLKCKITFSLIDTYQLLPDSCCCLSYSLPE